MSMMMMMRGWGMYCDCEIGMGGTKMWVTLSSWHLPMCTVLPLPSTPEARIYITEPQEGRVLIPEPIELELNHHQYAARVGPAPQPSPAMGCSVLGRGAEPPQFWVLLIWLEPGISHVTWVHYDATMCLACFVCSILPVLHFLRFDLFVL